MHPLQPSLRSKLALARPVIGTMVQFDCCEIVEIAGIAGYDYVMLDAEHGALDVAAITRLIRAADAVRTPAMVRVPDSDPTCIQRVMDAGATGVLVPRVRGAAEVEAAVRAARFAPRGERGACATTRAAGYWTENWAGFSQGASADALVWALVEDPEGVASAARIASVPGLDALVFGAFDLSQALGHRGNVQHTDVRAGFDATRGAAAEAGIDLVAIIAAEPDGAAGAARRGARILLDGFDAQIISAAYRQRVAKLRGDLKT